MGGVGGYLTFMLLTGVVSTLKLVSSDCDGDSEDSE